MFKFFKLSRYLDNLNVVQLKLLKPNWGKELITEFEKVLCTIAENEKSIKVIILSGTKNFCTGADLTDKFIKSKEGGIWMNERMTKYLEVLYNLPIISYAAINTLAIGGGAEMACSTDFRVLHKDAYIQFVHSKFGIIPGWGGYEKLSKIVGWQQAKSIIYAANKLDSEVCKSLGIADYISQNEHPEQFILQQYVELHDTVANPLNLVPFDTMAPEIEKGYIKGIKTVQSGKKRENDVFTDLWMSPYHISKLQKYNK
eukprot:NODE_95_length_21460_cov_0.300220.p8 type:complete len:257 gc:universal NODE_95_length_21460_cov_0.300220:6744-5974(-)